jgi:hypothetical protein
MKMQVFVKGLVQGNVWFLTDSVGKKVIMGLLPNFISFRRPPTGYVVNVCVTVEFRVVQEVLGARLQASDATFTPVNL